MFENMVTFRKEDATLELPTYSGTYSGDIRFVIITMKRFQIVLFDLFIESQYISKVSTTNNCHGRHHSAKHWTL